MGVYIKGLDMPKEGVWYNIMITSNGKGFVDVVSKDNALTKTEPIQAVEISIPHGRLIDADELISDLRIYESKYCGEQGYITQDDIIDAPTVIEAEE